MTIEEIYSRIKEYHPDAKLRSCIALINDALNELTDDTGERTTTTLDTVDGTEWYDLPEDCLKIVDVYYKNSSGDYRKIKRMVGNTIETRLT